MLEEPDRVVDFAAEEAQPNGSSGDAEEETDGGSREESRPVESPENIEKVLNSGLQFLSGVLEMATGKKLEPSGGDDRMIRIDRETG